MKSTNGINKLLAGACAVCMLTTTLLSTNILLAKATTYTEVVTPKFASYDEQGKPTVVEITSGDKFPASVAPTGDLTALDDTNVVSGRCAMQASSAFEIKMDAVSGGVGVLIYIKTPENEVQSHPQIYLIKNASGQVYRYEGADWYFLKDGDNKWTTAPVKNYGPDLPAGFEGYLYLPYDTFDNGTNTPIITSEDNFTGIKVWFAQNNDQAHIIGAPMVVKNNGLVNNLPTTDKVIVNGEEKPLFGNGEVVDNRPVVPYITVDKTPAELTRVEAPLYVEYNSEDKGYEPTLTVGNNFPDTVVASGGTAKVIENPCGIGTAPGMEVNGDFVVNMRGVKGGKGVMVYVKAPQTGEGTRLQLYLVKNVRKAQYQYGYKDWSYMEKGDTEWTTETIDNYGPFLPDGFEGYVYIPYEGITLVGNNEEQLITDDDALTGMKIWFATNAGETFQMSAPIVVSPAGLKDGLPTLNKVLVNGTETPLFRDGGGENPGGGGSEGGGDENDNPENLPDIDYGRADITEINVPELSKVLELGKPINSSSFDDWNSFKSSTLVDSIIGISKCPSIQIQKKTGPIDGQDNLSDILCSFYPKQKQAGGGEAMMMYIKMPENSPQTEMKMLLGFTDEKGRNVSAFVYSGVCQLLAKGEIKWQESVVNSYYFTLPAGFEGYIRFDYKYLATSNNLEGGVPSNYKLNTLHVYTPETSGDTITVSSPLIVTHQGESKDGAYINGNKHAARNIFTGKVMQKDEIVSALKIGDILTSLPEFTTDKVILDWDDNDVTTTTAKLAWEAFEGAASYRVDVFQKLPGKEGLEYLCTDIQTVTQTNITLTNLKANGKYAVMVTAFDKNGEELALYDYCNLQTPFEDGPNQNEEDDNDQDLPITGYASTVMIYLMSMLTCGSMLVLIVLNKLNVNKDI